MFDKLDKESCTITISLNENGQLLAKGKVLKDEPMALWMLEKAKDAVKQMHTPEPAMVKPAKGAMINYLGRK